MRPIAVSVPPPGPGGTPRSRKRWWAVFPLKSPDALRGRARDLEQRILPTRQNTVLATHKKKRRTPSPHAGSSAALLLACNKALGHFFQIDQ